MTAEHDENQNAEPAPVPSPTPSDTPNTGLTDFSFAFMTDDEPPTSDSGGQRTASAPPRRRRMSPQHIRRIKRRRRIRRILIAVLIVLLALLGFVGWFGVSAITAKNEVQAALQSATGLQDTLLSGDTIQSEQAGAAIQEFSGHVHNAYKQTSSPIWSVAAKMPYFGDDISAVRTAVTAMENIASQALPALQDTLTAVSNVSVQNGTIAIDGLAEAAQGLSTADTVMADALHLLDAAPQPHLDMIADALPQAREYVAELGDVVHNASVFANLAPSMLDTNGGAPRTYLILSQTNSELRPGGGLPGAWGTMTVANGSVSVQEFISSDFEFDAPVVDLTSDERTLFTDKLARNPKDVNFTPDFPRTGEIAADMWSQHSQQNVDGVIAIDPVFLQRMLAVSGPVTLQNGVTLDGANTAQYLLNQVYIDIPESEQNDYFSTVAATVFAHIMQNAGDPQGFLNAATTSITDGHLKLWSAHSDEQMQLETTPIAGALQTSASTPEVGVYFTDLSQAKMDWYLKREVSVEHDTTAANGAEQYTVHIKLTNTMTADEVATLPHYIVGPFLDDMVAGQIRTQAFVYAPAGGRLVDWSMSDGSGFDGITVHDGLTVGVKTFTLDPGASYEITCHVQAAPGIDTPLTLVQTPQVEGRTD